MSGTGVQRDRESPELSLVKPLTREERELEATHRRQAEVMRQLWERRGLLVRFAVVALLLSTLIAFLIPKSYTSVVELMPPDSQSSSALAMVSALAGKAGASLAGITGDLLGLKSSGALFVGILKSETSQDRIIQQFELQKVYGTKLLRDARKTLDSNTTISEDKKSGIISISVVDHKPERAAAIANAYVDELNLLVAQLSTSAAHRERVFLEDRLKVAKVELDEATGQLAQFSSRSGTLDMQTEGKAMLDAAATITGELIAAESQLQGLRQIYTDNNPRVRSLNARVAELRKQLEEFGGNQPAPQTSTASPLYSRAGQVADPPAMTNGSSPFPTIKNLPLLGAKYADYYRRAKIEETVFELLTEQYELAKVQEAKETPSVKVLDPGRVPEWKSSPPRLLIMILGTFLGLATAVLWILAAKRWQELDPSDPRKVLALEVAASVRAQTPWTTQNGNKPDRWSQRIWSRIKSVRPPTDGTHVP